MEGKCEVSGIESEGDSSPPFHHNLGGMVVTSTTSYNQQSPLRLFIRSSYVTLYILGSLQALDEAVKELEQVTQEVLDAENTECDCWELEQSVDGVLGRLRKLEIRLVPNAKKGAWKRKRRKGTSLNLGEVQEHLAKVQELCDALHKRTDKVDLSKFKPTLAEAVH